MSIKDQIAALEEATTNDFVELVKISGLDPKQDFRYANWQGLDFKGCDLRAFDFTGARLIGCMFDGALIDGATFTDAELEGANLEAAKDYVAYQARLNPVPKAPKQTVRRSRSKSLKPSQGD